MAKAKITYTATSPTGEMVEIQTTRTGVNFMVFMFNAYTQKEIIGLSTGTDPIKVEKQNLASMGAGYTGPCHVVPVK
jgi:hypothetical protein